MGLKCPSCGANNAEFNPRCTSCDAALPEASAPTVRTGPAGEETPPAASLPQGRRVSHYEVHERLGGGGMGEVYRATDTLLRRSVALKFLAPRLAQDAHARARFVREAQTASALDHPNIGTIYEIGEAAAPAPGPMFIAMALVEGRTLQDRIADGPLPFEEAAEVLRQLSCALATAHAAGIVHRDLKPSNVMLTRSGQVKILDFGLAKLQSGPEGSDTSLTEAGQALGTVAYMSPEQARGDTVDHRTDIWSAGVLAYEMLTGLRPFRADSKLGVLTRIVNEEPRPLAELRPDVPAPLQRLVARALRKDPRERYPTAEEMLRELGPAGGSRARSARSRRRMMFAAAAAAVLLAGGAAGYRLYAARDGEISRLPAPADRPLRAVQLRRSIAVLGFKNLSSEADKAWLSTALSEMLSTELAAGDRLRSIPGETVARAKLDLALAEADSFGAETLDRLRSRLGTDLVVVGSYLALGERGQSRIRLDLRLQDAAAGETLALISQSGREQELFELISRTGAALRERLGIAPRSEQEAQWVRTSLPSDPETARLYIEGLERWRVFDADAARRLLEQAVSRDPEFPLAHLVLAGALRHLGHFEKARQEAWRAMELSGSLPWQERLGVEAGYRLLAGEWQRATEIYRTLYEAEPDNVEYGMLLAEAQKHIGEAKEARETLAALRRLPAPASQDLRIDAWEARAFLMLDDFDSALAVARNLASRAQAVGARALFADAKYIEMLVLQGRAEHEKAIAAATEAQGLFAAVGDLDGVARQLQTVSELLLARGDAPGAWQKAQENLDVRRQIGDPGRVAEALAWIGVLQREQGHLAEAGRTFAEAVQMVQKAEDPSIERSVQEEWGFLMWSRGDLAGARQRLARIEELERGLETDWKGPNPRLLAIVLALEEERPAEAEALARKALAQDKAKRMCKLGALLRALLARALLAQGRTAEALGVVEEAEPLAEQGRILFARVCVATAAGRVRAATGRAAEVAEALRGLESAAAEAAQAGLVGLELEARLELGRAELAAGKAAEGSARLAAVAEAARDKGFGLVARKAEGERRERP